MLELTATTRPLQISWYYVGGILSPVSTRFDLWWTDV